MLRRDFLSSGALTVAGLPVLGFAESDKWGRDQGYPTGWAGGLEKGSFQRVGNYSGGFETMLPHHTIGAAPSPFEWIDSIQADFKFRWGFFDKTPTEYLDRWPVTGLLIARKNHVIHESYRFNRTATMRLTSWSMAKSVTSLLLGICMDRKLIDSYDDVAEKYVPQLQGCLHGQTTLRNLSNMSSGADITHNRDNHTIYPAAYLSKTASIRNTVMSWNRRREEQGKTFNYNELCPLTIGMVIRNVSGGSMSVFAQDALWRPMGAEADATWTTDSEQSEFNCIGFAARLRDWARLGLLVANKGRINGQQVFSERWINECTNWGPQDQQARVGVATRNMGYKAHMWHAKSDGSRLYFNGHHGQQVLVDMPTQTVLVQTAVSHDGNWQSELFAMMDAATKV